MNWNNPITNKSLTVILGVSLVFTLGVGLWLGKILFSPSKTEPYIFTPDHIAETKPKLVMKLETEEQVKQVKPLLSRDANLAKIGNYVVFGKRGRMHIAKAEATEKIVPLKPNEVKISKQGDFVFTPTHIHYRKIQKLDKIETEEELKIYEKHSSEFANPQDLGIGKYVAYHPKSHKTTYLYHVVGVSKKIKPIKIESNSIVEE